MYRAASAEGKEFRIRVGVDVGKEGDNSQAVMITWDAEGKKILRVVKISIADRPLSGASMGRRRLQESRLQEHGCNKLQQGGMGKSSRVFWLSLVS